MEFTPQKKGSKMFDMKINMPEIFQHREGCIGIAVLQDDGKVG